jgi:hypothetical protein
MLLSWRSLSHSSIQLSSPWAAELHQRPFLWEGIATEQTQHLLIEQEKRGRYHSGSAQCVLTGHSLKWLLLWEIFKLSTFSFKFNARAFLLKICHLPVKGSKLNNAYKLYLK